LSLKRIAIPVSVLICAAVFIADCVTPRGVAEANLYIFAVLVLIDRKKSTLFMLGGVITVLTIIGYIISLPGVPLYFSIVNRGVALFTLWVLILIITLLKEQVLKRLALQNELKIKTEAATQNLNLVKEKEVLLRELHHRVKNNLQILISISNLYSSKLERPEVAELMGEFRNAVYSIALVHAGLSKDGVHEELDFSDYIESIMDELIRSLQGNRKITLVKSLQKFPISLNRAVCCGLITNELVTNAVKHGFRKRENGTLTIELEKKEGMIRLAIGDDGAGPQGGIDIENATSVGLDIVRSLVSQLEGAMRVDSKNGTKFIISFPDVSAT
jgi:two-component sensor histidine kinase